MKVGIISINMYSKGLNFACPLHTYAFQQFLIKNGIDCTVIDYIPVYFDNFDMEHPSDYYKMLYDRCVTRLTGDKEKDAPTKQKMRRYKHKHKAWGSLAGERITRYRKMQNFIDQHYIKTEQCYNSDLLEVQDPGFDCYICATDVIWKNQPDFGFDRGFFLGSTCMEQKWKFAYSASRGAYVARDDEEKDLFFYYLNDFDAISVRESTLKKYLEENSSLNVTHVLDPVLMHDAEFYDQIAVKPPEEHYVLLYYVMEKANDTIQHAVNFAKRHHMKIIEITDNPVKGGKLSEYPGVDYTFHFDIGIEDWIGYIKFADYIFTNSFHGCCLSLLYEKNFYIGFRKSSDKVNDLMETFGLFSRYLPESPENAPEPGLPVRVQSKLEKHLGKYLPALFREKPMDYTDIREILKKRRKESEDFILSAIHNAENSERTHRDYESHKRALTYPIRYNTNLKNRPFAWTYDESAGTLKHLTSGSLEYNLNNEYGVNDGTTHLLKNGFHLDGYTFKGWNIRIRIDNDWFWYLADGTLTPKDSYRKDINGPVRLFKDEEVIPYLPVNRISALVADALWKKEEN